MLGGKFDEALALASDLHRRQKRKSVPVPYLSHLMGVASLVLEANAYLDLAHIEDLAIAALLHDAIEDQGDRITLDEIRARFGDRVHDIVRDCSDSVGGTPDAPRPPWRQRKAAYIAGIGGKGLDSLLVSSADKLHNARAILFDHRKLGAEVWARFNPEPEEILWYYRSLQSAFITAWPDNPLLDELDTAVQGIEAAVAGATG